MTKQGSRSVLFLLFALLIPASALAQTRIAWAVASDIRNGERGSIVGRIDELGSGSFRVLPDDEKSGVRVRVVTDSVVTKYLGFGTTSGTKADVFTGPNGFAKLRTGDRVEVRGNGTGNSAVTATEVILLGRGLNTTSTSTANSNRFDGTVRSVSSSTRFVVETTQREMQTVYGTENTPVYYKGEAFRIRNIEVGDTVRIDVETRTSDGVRARSIDVLRSVTDSDSGTDRRITSLVGRITRVDSRLQTLRIDTGRGDEVRVDTRSATDSKGRDVKLTDWKVGDQVRISGEYDTAGDFRADTLRRATAAELEDRDDGDIDFDDEEDTVETAEEGDRYVSVVLNGTVQKSLKSSDALVIKDSSSGKNVPILVDDYFIVRAKSGDYITADQIKAGDRVVIKAFRDASRNYIAQTIRIR